MLGKYKRLDVNVVNVAEGREKITLAAVDMVYPDLGYGSELLIQVLNDECKIRK